MVILTTSQTTLKSYRGFDPPSAVYILVISVAWHQIALSPNLSLCSLFLSQTHALLAELDEGSLYRRVS